MEIRKVIPNLQLVNRMIVDFYLVNFHPADEPEAFAAVGSAVGLGHGNELTLQIKRFRNTSEMVLIDWFST